MERSFPRDLNLAYGALPEIYARMANGRYGELSHFIMQPGGWYNAALAAWLHLAGRSGLAFTAAGALWAGLLPFAAYRLGSASGTSEGAASEGEGTRARWAGTGAAALVAAAPGLTFQAQAGWIHIPEAALVALAAAAFAHDSGLWKRSTVATMAACGGLAIGVRPSGVTWVLVLAVALFAAPQPRREWRVRACTIGAIWLLACRVPLPVMLAYSRDHWAIRGRYIDLIPNIADQFVHELGVPGLMFTVGGLGTLAIRRFAMARSVRFIVLGWILLALAMFAAVRCGLDNFPLLFVALAALAGVGLAGDARNGMFLAIFSLASLGYRLGVDVLSPAPSLPSTRIARYLDGTCPDRAHGRPCVVYIDQGLFFPQSEEPGGLELFLMGEGRVQAIALTQRRGGEPAPDALATWNCGERDTLWLQRFPHAVDERERVIRQYSLTTASTRETDGCTFLWMTPGGGFVGTDPDGL